MILPVLGGGFVGAVVLAAVIGLQGPERYPAPAQADTNAADQVGFREAGTLSALDLQRGRLLQHRPAPARSGHQHADQHGRGRPVRVAAHRPGDRQGRVLPHRHAGRRPGQPGRHGLRGRTAPEGGYATLTDPAYSTGTLVPADDTTWTAGRTIACVVMSDGPRTGSALK